MSKDEQLFALTYKRKSEKNVSCPLAELTCFLKSRRLKVFTFYFYRCLLQKTGLCITISVLNPVSLNSHVCCSGSTIKTRRKWMQLPLRTKITVMRQQLLECIVMIKIDGGPKQTLTQCQPGREMFFCTNLLPDFWDSLSIYETLLSSTTS